MKYLLFFLIFTFYGCALNQSYAQTIQPSKRFGSWIGAAPVKAQSSEYDINCDIDVDFRLTFYQNGGYDVEVLDASSLCHILLKGMWDTFLDQNEVEFTTCSMFKSGSNYYLNFGLSGLDDDNLKHIKQEASQVQVLRLDDQFLKIRVDLLTSSLKSQILLLRRE